MKIVSESYSASVSHLNTPLSKYLKKSFSFLLNSFLPAQHLQRLNKLKLKQKRKLKEKNKRNNLKSDLNIASNVDLQRECCVGVSVLVVV